VIHLPGIFFGIQIQFFPVSCTNNPVSLLRCHDGCRSFPSLYRKKRQSFTALFMDGNLPRPLGSRQLYLCRDLTPARFISGSSSALRAPDGRSHQRNFILLFTMAGACLIVFLVPGLFVLFPGILCGIASHLIEPGLKKALAID